MKLYPVKSGCVKPTALNSGFSIPNSVINFTEKIELVFYHKLSELANFGYLFAGENTGIPYATTGMYLTSGQGAYSMYWKGSTSGACAINMGAITDGNWYKMTCNISASNISFKLNKLTKVNNVTVESADINSSVTAKGTATITGELGILSLKNSNNVYNYASGNKIAYIKFYGANNTLLYDFSFCNGNGTKVVNLVDGINYQLSNITVNTFWGHTQDFHHRNFTNGYTKYTNLTGDILRITRGDNGQLYTTSQIGYTLDSIKDSSTKKWNQSESLFKLDDVSAVTTQKLFITFSNVSAMNGWYDVAGTNEGQPYYDNSAGYRVVYSAGYWYFTPVVFAPVYRTSTTDILSEIVDVGGGSPLPVVSFENFTTQSPLYTADFDHVLFTDGTGVAKEIDLSTYECNSGFDRGFLYFDTTLNSNFMLYENDKTLTSDTKIVKYISLGDRIMYDEGGSIVYDENDHTILSEIDIPS